MIIRCYRCGKDMATPNSTNADYITADDIASDEEVEVIYALKHTEQTRDKLEKGEKIPDDLYQAIEIRDVMQADNDSDVARVVRKCEVRRVQKTAIICPECHKPGDFVIWGVHNE